MDAAPEFQMGGCSLHFRYLCKFVCIILRASRVVVSVRFSWGVLGLLGECYIDLSTVFAMPSTYDTSSKATMFLVW